MTSKYEAMYSLAVSVSERPCSTARWMILSSTSVKFWTYSSWNPRKSRYRRITSMATNVRAWPTCGWNLGVMPQTYIRTTPSGWSGTRLSSRPERVEYIRSGTVLLSVLAPEEDGG